MDVLRLCFLRVDDAAIQRLLHLDLHPIRSRSAADRRRLHGLLWVHQGVAVHADNGAH